MGLLVTALKEEFHFNRGLYFELFQYDSLYFILPTSNVSCRDDLRSPMLRCDKRGLVFHHITLLFSAKKETMHEMFGVRVWNLGGEIAQWFH